MSERLSCPTCASPGLDLELVAALRLAADRLKAEYQGYVGQAAPDNLLEPPPFPAG